MWSMFIGNICAFFVFAAAIIVITNVTFIQLCLYDARVAGFRNFFYFFEMISDFSCLARSFLMISYFAVFAVYFEWHTTELQIWTHLFFCLSDYYGKKNLSIDEFTSFHFILRFFCFLFHCFSHIKVSKINPIGFDTFIHQNAWVNFSFLFRGPVERKRKERDT